MHYEVRHAQRGQVALPDWGKVWQLADFPRVRGRFDAVLAVLAARKSAVAGLIDYSFVTRLVLNPAGESKLKSNNTAAMPGRRRIRRSWRSNSQTWTMKRPRELRKNTSVLRSRPWAVMPVSLCRLFMVPLGFPFA